MNKKLPVLLFLLASLGSQASAQNDSLRSVVDEVIWVVGDEAILKSDVEAMRMQSEQEGLRWSGDPDCSIPEQIAVQKLYLNQAITDSIQVTEAEISQNVEQYIERMISVIGSREKLEEYQKKNMSQIRADLRESFRERQLVEGMQQKLVKDVAVSPAEVRRYFRNLPQDSIPFVPTEVEVQIITQQPRVEQEEINRIKERLREFTDRINKGETSFQTLARLYSQDGSARNGGELGYTGRAGWVPEFANVAFNLTDPKKVSKIVETEFGYHIIQLIDKRGDKVNVRHILLKPEISNEAIQTALNRLDTVATAIREDVAPEMIKAIYKDKDGRAIEHFTFEDGVAFFSDDKDTRNNNGLMFVTRENQRTSRFQLAELPSEVARIVDTLQVGGVSAPFQMINERGKVVCAVVKLKNRREGHKATITEDFQIMKNVVTAKQRQKKLHDWVVNRIKSTYVRVNDRYRDCKFEYEGWIR
jgi:peptidyl-prolyl cis-trans isomerase SurA